MSRKILIGAALAASLLFLLVGNGFAAVPTEAPAGTAEAQGLREDVPYCETGTPAVNCYTYGCTGSIGKPATCRWYVCKVWTGFGCLV